ncbi:alpha-ribazole phosphatase family protein [Flammeovirga kamogawensis]|uniref:phosphoglycerate mutase (2,3-diphosphoglycerate-dependent) n=1 Tax=Flammeovirga kamogawensis TaxID=373891 RepID=A0ABX8GQW2_9BACT|nr:alpha-ribazole phosphatase family protein [Flammeovirga kamogawensis]MBB6463198.1 alpha-ribazole phosphatase [Flammeovirga kamogawensis]QWG05949.1 alpha-ribazole phosphatase family protein [Flammeovirga kamogawensis]TRX67775.1 alpha-ribazole phosphatase family protein [Flammeovirga kamogawensis]
MSMTIYLVRHTTPDVDASKILYGQTDLDIVESFQEEVNAIKKRTNNTVFNTIYYSPLLRCEKLALSLTGDLKLPDSRLKEIFYGDWEMNKFSELRNNIKEWVKVFDHKPAPNGESLMDVQTRVRSFWQDRIEYKEGDQIAIVTHGVVMRIILSHFLEMPLKNIFRFQFDFGKVIKLTMTEEGLVKIHI